jgi:hypothetical protein
MLLLLVRPSKESDGARRKKSKSKRRLIVKRARKLAPLAAPIAAIVGPSIEWQKEAISRLEAQWLEEELILLMLFFDDD